MGLFSPQIANVVGRAELLSAVLFFASLLSYMHAVRRDASVGGVGFVLAVVLAGLAVVSKEQGIMALILCAAYDVFVVCGLGPVRGVAMLVGGGLVGEDGTWAWGMRKRVWLLAAAFIVMVVGRLQMNHGGSVVLNPFEHAAVFHPSQLVWLLSTLYYALVSFGLLLFPNHLCIDWSFGTIPLIESAYDCRFSLLIFAAISLLFALRYAFINQHKTDYIALRMGLTLMLVTYLPSSGLLFRVGFVVAERVLYLPR